MINKTRFFAWQPSLWIIIAITISFVAAKLVYQSHGSHSFWLLILLYLPPLAAVSGLLFWKRSRLYAGLKDLPRTELLAANIVPLIIIGIAMLTLFLFFFTNGVSGI